MMRILIFATTLLLFSFTSHKFYVSVNQIDFNQSKKRLEITNRIFIDDLNASLNASTTEKFEIEDMTLNSKSFGVLQSYLNKHLIFKINKKQKEFQIKNFEIEGDVFVIYSVLGDVSNVKSLEVENSLLFDLIPSQQHIVHFNINETKSSKLLDFESRKTMLNL